MRIYVAGPLSSPHPATRLANVHAALDAGIALMQRGHVPFIPHLTHYVDLRQQETGADIGYEEWMTTDMEWLRLCHGILFLGHSPGADRELAYAQATLMTIWYELGDVPVNRPSSVAT